MSFVLVGEHSFIWQTQLYRFFILHLEFSITDFVSFLQFPLYLIFLPYGHFWLPFWQRCVLCWSVNIVLYDKLKTVQQQKQRENVIFREFHTLTHVQYYFYESLYGHFWHLFCQFSSFLPVISLRVDTKPYSSRNCQVSTKLASPFGRLFRECITNVGIKIRDSWLSNPSVSGHHCGNLIVYGCIDW